METTIAVQAVLENITPVRVGDLPDFLAAITPLWDIFKDKKSLDESDILPALTSHISQFIDAVRIGSHVDKDWLANQTVDVLVQLAARVFEVNMDFFVQALAVLPGAEVMAAEEPEVRENRTGGLNPSQVLSGPDSTTKA